MVVVPSIPVVNRLLASGNLYGNDTFGGSFPVDLAVDLSYNTQWRGSTTPVGGAPSGTLTMPVYIAMDLSGLPLAQRQQWLLNWYQDGTNGVYDFTLFGANPSNLPSAYTIDINNAAGGSLPVSGWTTVVTVSGSTYNSRQHFITASGANWIRMTITAINGTSINNNPAIESFDLYDVSSGHQDVHLVMGDSIIAQGFNHVPDPCIPQQIQNLGVPNFPAMQAAGIPGYTATDLEGVLSTWLGIFGGTYAYLNVGTNDANEGGAPLADYSAAMQSMITTCQGAGLTVIIQKTICWGSAAGILANGPTINADLAALFLANPGVIQGPDLWAFFQANPSLISGDGIHPTLPAGYAAYQKLWVQSLGQSLYGVTAGGGVKIFKGKGSRLYV